MGTWSNVRVPMQWLKASFGKFLSYRVNQPVDVAVGTNFGVQKAVGFRCPPGWPVGNERRRSFWHGATSVRSGLGQIHLIHGLQSRTQDSTSQGTTPCRRLLSWCF